MSNVRQGGRFRGLFRSAWLRMKLWDVQLSDSSFAASESETTRSWDRRCRRWHEVRRTGRPLKARCLAGHPPVRMQGEHSPEVNSLPTQPVPHQRRLTWRERPCGLKFTPFKAASKYRYIDSLRAAGARGYSPTQLGDPFAGFLHAALDLSLEVGSRAGVPKRQDRSVWRQRRSRGGHQGGCRRTSDRCRGC